MERRVIGTGRWENASPFRFLSEDWFAPIPAPVRIGRRGPDYPWPWSVVPRLPEDIAAHTRPADNDRAAVTLATFLAALHMPAPARAPRNPVRGVRLAHRASPSKWPPPSARLADDLNRFGPAVDRRAVTGVWDVAVQTPGWTGLPSGCTATYAPPTASSTAATSAA
jgi:hypothetical protein